MAYRRQSPEISLNLNVRDLDVSATLAIQERSNQLREQGRHIFRLGLGQSPFPVPRPVVEELKANAHQKDYLPVRGLATLRDAVADYHRKQQHVGYTYEDVLIGPGSKELMFILQLVYYGDLLIPSPSWVSYAPQAQIIGRKVRWMRTQSQNGWRLTAEELERVCHKDPDRPRIVILNYPNNPTGGTFKKDELKALAKVARKYRVIMLSDEIYGELHHKGQHVSIARFYPEGTIISSGLSKWCGAGGWRLGTFTFPKGLRWLLDAMAVVSSETYTSTSAPIQYAAVRAFKGGIQIEDYLRQSRRILRGLKTVITEILDNSDIAFQKPKGGFYIFPDFSPLAEKLAAYNVESSDELVSRLLEDTGIACLPGTAFGRPEEELTARMAYVDFDGARAIVAAEQVPIDQPLGRDFFETYCGNVVNAFSRLVEWSSTL